MIYGFEMLYEGEVAPVELAAGILNDAGAVISTVPLPSAGKSLTGRAADDDIDFARSDELLQFLGGELGKVFFKRVGNVLEVSLENLNGFFIEVDGGKALEVGPLHAEAETAAAAKEVDEGGLHKSTPSQSWAVVMPRAFAKRAMFIIPGLRFPRSMSLT